MCLDLHDFEKRLGYKFHDISLLETALTHTSYANEHKVVSYERLEFLGDAVLQMLTSKYIYKAYPDFPEGKMSRLRANIVCETTLSHIAERLGIGEAARLGRGEELTGGRTRPSILADMVEAILAAVYIDGGIEKAEGIIFDAYGHIIEAAAEGRLIKDYKTELQEKVQTGGKKQPEYAVIAESGPAHDKTFTMEVSIDGEARGRGSGKTKQEAQQMAAKAALEKLGE